MRTKITVLIILCALVGAVLGSCSRGKYMQRADGPATSAEKAPSSRIDREARSESAASSLSDLAQAAETPRPTADRRIILNGSISLTVKSVPEAVKRIRTIQAAAGGYMNSSSMDLAGDDTREGTVVIRIPQDAFDAALAKIRKLGKVESETVKGEDVTDQFVDAEAHLRNLNREEERILLILERSGSITDVLQVEQELSRVRGDIEQITGRLNQLRNQIEYATLTVNLSETPPPAPVAEPGTWNFRGTLGNAVRAFLGFVNVLIRAAIWLGVFLPFLIVLYIVARIVRRRRR